MKLCHPDENWSRSAFAPAARTDVVEAPRCPEAPQPKPPSTSMHIRTVHATVPAAREAVFNFLADVENLPRWAGEFCGGLELHRGAWRAYTALGELDVEIRTGDGYCEFDLRLGAVGRPWLAVPFRVRSDGEAGSLVSFSCGQAAGWDDAQRARLADALVDGLHGLAVRMEAGRPNRVEEPVAG